MLKLRKVIILVALLGLVGLVSGCRANDCGCPKYQVESSDY